LIFAAVKEYTKSNKKIEESNLTNLHIASKYYDSIGLNGKRAYKELSFPLRETVNSIYGEDFYDKRVYPQLKQMLEKILDNFKDYLLCINTQSKNYKGCFQNIAIDIMPDEDFHLWLLEINANPGMNAPIYHWGNLENFANSVLNRTSDVVFDNKKIPVSTKGFDLIK
jgi:hypothetical protein